MNKLFIWDDMLRIMDTYGCRPYNKILPVHGNLLLKIDENTGGVLNICSIISHDVSDNIF